MSFRCCLMSLLSLFSFALTPYSYASNPHCPEALILASTASLDGFYDDLLSSTVRVTFARFPDGRELPLSRMEIGFSSAAFCVGASCEEVLWIPKSEASEPQFEIETSLRPYLKRAGIEVAEIASEGTQATIPFQMLKRPIGISLSDLLAAGSLSDEQQASLLFLYRRTKAIGVTFDLPWESLIWVPEKKAFVYSHGDLLVDSYNVEMRLNQTWPRRFGSFLPKDFQKNEPDESSRFKRLSAEIAEVVKRPEQRRKTKTLASLLALPLVLEATPSYNLRVATPDTLAEVLNLRRLPSIAITSHKSKERFHTVPPVYSDVGGFSLQTTQEKPAVICDIGAAFCTSMISFASDGSAVQVHHPFIDETRGGDEVLAKFQTALSVNLSGKGPLVHVITGMNVINHSRRELVLEQLPLSLPEGSAVIGVTRWSRKDRLVSPFLPPHDGVMGFIFVPRYLSKTGQNEILIVTHTGYERISQSRFYPIFATP